VQMATPWKHPQSGAYYLYRQIPVPLRMAFGGKQFWKKSLRTKCPDKARSEFTAENAEFERLLSAARSAQMDDVERSCLTAEAAQTYVARWCAGQPSTSATCFWAESAASDLGFRFLPGDTLDAARVDDDEDPSEKRRVCGEGWLDFVAHHKEHDWVKAGEEPLWAIHTASGAAYSRSPANDIAILRAFSSAVRDDVDRVRERRERPRRSGSERLRPDLHISELFTEWNAKRQPRKQSAYEAQGHVDDLVDFIGDVKVASINRAELYDYRDAAASLPATMPRADRALPFRHRVAKHKGTVVPRVGADTVKKRIGTIAALLGFAVEELWLANNIGNRIPIVGYKRTKRNRRSFRDGELKQLFESTLFLKPQAWRYDGAVSDCTLAWLFLIGLTTGGRLEEMGKPPLASICQDLHVTIIDIDGLVKTDESRRIIPIHGLLNDLGFPKFVDALRRAGATMLFPDLIANTFDKMTKEASRIANRYIDAKVGADARLVFYSLRHKFKDMARKAGIIDSTIDRICGHAPVTPGGRYGDGVDAATLYREVMKIDFSMIDVSSLRAAWASIDWDEIAAKLVAAGRRNDRLILK
jgi:hypothetical protein